MWLFSEKTSRPPLRSEKSSGGTDGNSYFQPSNLLNFYYFIYEILWNLHLSFLFYVENILVCNGFFFAEKSKWKRKNSSSKENHWRRVVGRWKHSIKYEYMYVKIHSNENYIMNLCINLISIFKMEINRKEEMTKRRKMLQMELMVWCHTYEVIKHNWLNIVGCF